jgi:calcium-dependent protein kinase
MDSSTVTSENLSPFKTIRDLKVRDKYTILKQVGDGVSGAVFLAENKVTLEKRAIKRILKNQLKNPEEYARNEIAILMRLDHPNIVKMYETYEDSKSFCMVMEMCQGGELFDTIVDKSEISESHEANIFRQMVMAVNYLHLNNIVHRDLKPENIMLYDEEASTIVKLIDFGIAKQCFTSE